MKLAFKCLGVIETAQIEIKDLTIICGKNNTGKTYVTYLIYCLLMEFKKYISIDYQQEFEELLQKKFVKINLQTKIINNLKNIIEESTSKFIENFPSLMASQSKLFNKFTLETNLILNDDWKVKPFSKELYNNNGELLFKIEKNKDSEIVELIIGQNTDENFLIFIQREIIHNIIFKTIIPKVFICSAERTGATIFRKDLDLASKNVVDILNKAQKDGKVSLENIFKTFMEENKTRIYAKPILDNVDFISGLPDDGQEHSPLIKKYPELMYKIQEITGGIYSTKNGVTAFQPNNTTKKLSLNEVSSAARSLLILFYWLKYKANIGDMLIIDEPELNLHPANQRKLARFLVSLINKGIKVFITTHSDYIIREFNTLIMLNQNKPHIKHVIDSFKTKGYDENDKLDYKKVALYIAATKNLKSKSITLNLKKISAEYGIEIDTFDNTIDEMNAIQEAIYYGK